MRWRCRVESEYQRFVVVSLCGRIIDHSQEEREWSIFFVYV